MTKVLFLDVDGVLNGHEKLPGSMYCGILPRCMAALNLVVATTDCKLVISSAWRYLMLGKRRSMSVAGFQNMLATHGLVFPYGEQVVIDCTKPDKAACEGEAGLVQRGEQIMEWLDRKWERLKVTTWAVVDDLAVRLYSGDEWRLVQTDGAKGLTHEDADKLIEILGGIAT